MRNRTPTPVLLALLALLALTACAAGHQDEPAGGDQAYPALRAAICDTLHNSFRCARAIEARQLPGAERATRLGDTLRLALDSDTLELVDRTGDPAEGVHYSYQDRWADTGKILVQLQYYEGSEYLLVDEATGETTSLPDWPLRSPEGRRFAVLAEDLVAGYGPNTLQIWELVDGEPVRRWHAEPESWGPVDGRWEDETSLRFTRRGFCDQLGGTGQGMCERPGRVVLEDGSWSLAEEGAPDGG